MRFGVLPLRGQPAGVQRRDGRIPVEENLEADLAELADGCRRRNEADGDEALHLPLARFFKES